MMTMQNQIIQLIQKKKGSKTLYLDEEEVKLIKAYHELDKGRKLKNCQSCIIEYFCELYERFKQ